MRRRGGLVWLWAAAAVLVIVGLVLLWPRPADRGEADAPAGEPVMPVDSASPVEGPGLRPGNDHVHDEPWTRQPWRPVAEGFARDFTNPAGGAAAWRTRLARWVSGYLVDQYRLVPVTEIPVGGRPSVAPVRLGGTLVDVEIDYRSGLVVGVRLELTPGTGWVVTTVRELAAGLS